MKSLITKVIVFFIVLFLFVPLVQASVYINEIMYNPKGSNSTHSPWVEILNTSSENVDLSGWKFDDGDVSKHVLNVPPKNGGQGSLVVPAGGYIIFADNATNFLADYPSFSGSVIDTIVSPLVSGGTVALLDANNSVVDSVTFSKDLGAYDDGNSLQKVDGNFITALPTPGAGTLENNQNSSTNTNTTSTSTETSSTANANNYSWPVEPQIFANAGPDRVTVVGADVIFEGKALGLEKKPLEGARYVWNFGDGSTKEGQSVAHVYKYPGEYTAVLEVASGYFSGSDRAKVIAEESKIFISSLGNAINNYIELTNGSNYEIDMSFWIIKSGSVTFYLPARTYIGGNKKLIIPAESSGIIKALPNDTELLYPNSALANRFSTYIDKNGNKIITGANTVNVQSNKSSSIAVLNNDEASNKQENPSYNNTATALLSDDNSGTDGILPKNYLWLVGVLGIIAISFIGVSFVSKNGLSKNNGKKLNAKDFKIIEEKE
ncbi:MAG: lamin tail domain-containing protein [Patescibacteria group bacterium]